ncbi:MAG: glycine--tRNA ligase subunit beta [Burkholderiaceae bacterium]
MTSRSLLVELLVEELPPKALQMLGDSFARLLADSLKNQGLAPHDAHVTSYATPRRLAALVSAVTKMAPDKAVSQKLMPVSVGLDDAGNASPALLKRLHALGGDSSAVPRLKRAMDGKAEALFFESIVPGATLVAGLQKALDEAIAKLPIPKVMSYQLESDCALPGWSSVSFVRPAHGLVALHGSQVVDVRALGLRSGNTTQGHRFESRASPVVIAEAEHYASTLLHDGSVIAGFAERRAEIARQLALAAREVGGGVGAIEDAALLDEVTALVERPQVLVCAFEPEFLEVPQECLVLTMKANQKYFPLLDAAGKLSNKFLVVSNIRPEDASAVIGGNERVVRPRLADAKFFFDQDRKKTLESRVQSLAKIVYHNKLGTQGERTQRVRAIARHIAQALEGESLVQAADTAARLAKADLVTEMVGEFPELQGVMGGYYALHDGLDRGTAFAIEDHYKPRFAGDALPRNDIGLAVALADKLETLVGMFAIGNLPTGDRDPFALRRHALGIVRMLIERDLNLSVVDLIQSAFDVLDDESIQREAWELRQQVAKADGSPATPGATAARAAGFSKRAFDPKTVAKLGDFIFERLAGSLREQGYSAHEVDAVLSIRPQRLGDIPKRLSAVRAFGALPEAPALAAANKRVGNILRKADAVDPHVSEVLLHEPAEKALYAAMQQVAPQAQAQFEGGDYTASLQTLAALRAPVDAFFDTVMVNAEQLDVRLNRQGLLQSLHVAMNRIADLSRLATGHEGKP